MGRAHPDGERLQVKARVVTGTGLGERQLSAFRSWDFEAAVIVLFDDDFAVRHAAHLPVGVLREAAVFMTHVNGWRVIATDELLDRGEDWTERLREVEYRPAPVLTNSLTNRRRRGRPGREKRLG